MSNNDILGKKTSKGLGKGLGALLASDGNPEIATDSIVNLKITDIVPNIDQPRKIFDTEKLEELAASIKEKGIIIPIIVNRENNIYKIVAGERRWRAAKLAGLALVPAIVRNLTQVEVLQQALIENIQRQDLNPMEEADALSHLISEHRLTQEELAKTVGKSRPAIANSLRLLNLPEEIKSMVISGELTAGHARAILSLDTKEKKLKAANILIERQASVRDAEKLVKQLSKPPKDEVKSQEDKQYISSILEFEAKLARRLGTRVKLRDRNRKGSIVIEYYSYDDLDRLYELMGGEEE